MVFKEGKASEITGTLAAVPPIPSATLTLGNFKRLQVGMTEQQVAAILGRPWLIRFTNKDDPPVCVWEETAQIRASILKGKVVDDSLTASSTSPK